MRQGGSYKVDKGGKPKLVEQTRPHPEGNAPRDADGKAIDVHADSVKTVEQQTPKPNDAPTAAPSKSSVKE